MKAFDTLTTLRELKSIVAATGDRQAIDRYNAAVRAARGEDADSGPSAYKLMNDAKLAPDAIEPLALHSQITIGQDYETMCKKFHRKNPSEVQL
jgi:hypothetical protein